MKGDFRDEAHRFEDIDKAVLAKIKRQAMTKDTPERWVYQFHKEPLGGGEHTDVFTFGAADVSIEGFALYAGATKAGVGFASVAWSQRNLIEKCAFVVGGYGVYANNIADSPGHHLT
ncbi:hypothetical protein LCGC14_2925660, partial [marine sediment metagenome]